MLNELHDKIAIAKCKTGRLAHVNLQDEIGKEGLFWELLADAAIQGATESMGFRAGAVLLRDRQV